MIPAQQPLPFDFNQLRYIQPIAPIQLNLPNFDIELFLPKPKHFLNVPSDFFHSHSVNFAAAIPVVQTIIGVGRTLFALIEAISGIAFWLLGCCNDNLKEEGIELLKDAKVHAWKGIVQIIPFGGTLLFLNEVFLDEVDAGRD